MSMHTFYARIADFMKPEISPQFYIDIWKTRIQNYTEN